MSEQENSITVKNYERDKLYRIVRRQLALKNLLYTIDNSDIDFEKGKETLKQKIENDIEKCELRKKRWWETIGKRYQLQINTESFEVSLYNGCIYKRQ